MCQGFSHFSGFLYHFVLATLNLKVYFDANKDVMDGCADMTLSM